MASDETKRAGIKGESMATEFPIEEASGCMHFNMNDELYVFLPALAGLVEKTTSNVSIPSSLLEGATQFFFMHRRGWLPEHRCYAETTRTVQAI
jgi:hypothetical protein